MIAALTLIALSQQKRDRPPSQWPPQWRDRYEVQIGGARLGMTQKEFNKLIEAERRKSPTKDSLLAKMHTEFKDGRLRAMSTDENHPNSNIPMPGTSIADAKKLTERLGVRWGGRVNAFQMFGRNTVWFLCGEENIFSVSVNDWPVEVWGITSWYEPDWVKRRDPKNWIMSGNYFVTNHRPFPVEIELSLVRVESQFPGSNFNDPNPYHLKAETLTNVKPGEMRKIPFTLPAVDYTKEDIKQYSYHFEIEKITERR